MRTYHLLLTAVLMIVMLGCTTPPPADPPITVAEIPTIVPVEHQANPDSIEVTQEVYDHTLAEVKVFIDHLNDTIRNKNYTVWKNALTDERFARISSPEFLAEISEENALKSRKIVLRSANDYFTQVVVPSRSNSVVDEIEFTGENTVKVFHLDISKGEPRRLRLYELMKTGSEWKIIQ